VGPVDNAAYLIIDNVDVVEAFLDLLADPSG